MIIIVIIMIIMIMIIIIITSIIEYFRKAGSAVRKSKLICHLLSSLFRPDLIFT